MSTKTGEDQSLKTELGLHYLSATLLSPRRPIHGQLKPYENASILFMRVPLQGDLEIVNALKDMVNKEMASETDFIAIVI